MDEDGYTHAIITVTYTNEETYGKLAISKTGQMLMGWDSEKRELIDAMKEQSLEVNKKVDCFSITLSELAGRVDASYHIPIVKRITEHLEKYASEVTTLGDPNVCADIILPGRFKRVYVEEGYGRVFIGGKQLICRTWLSSISSTTEPYV